MMCQNIYKFHHHCWNFILGVVGHQSVELVGENRLVVEVAVGPGPGGAGHEDVECDLDMAHMATVPCGLL